jgi:hypothetical protein
MPTPTPTPSPTPTPTPTCGVTTAELLADCNRQIRSILRGAQSEQAGGRAKSRARLSELVQLRRELQRQLAEENGTSGVVARADLSEASYE